MALIIGRFQLSYLDGYLIIDTGRFFSLISIVFYVLSIKMVKSKLISLNTRGISNFRKRRMIFAWLRKQKPDVFLQETHSTQGIEALWKRDATLF